jgi:hypothetical protein
MVLALQDGHGSRSFDFLDRPGSTSLRTLRAGLGDRRRTTRYPGYATSQRLRKRVEEALGWIKTTGGLRKGRHRGGDRVVRCSP